MAKQAINNVKLGLFVLGGLLFLIILLYMIGKNRNLFGATYVLKARFEHVQGLVSGNNVRFSGIEAGTVKKITILNDTVIEVTMIVDKKMKQIIRKNAIASIGTDGLVGNKVLNIAPARQASPLAEENDILVSRKSVDTEEMMQTLYKTNKDVSVIAEELKATVQRINQSSALWSLLNDQSVPDELRRAVAGIRSATGHANEMAGDLHEIIADVKKGKGAAGTILRDTIFAQNLNETVLKIKRAGEQSDSLVVEMRRLLADVRQDINSGKGAANALLKDSVLTARLNESLDNIRDGTNGFNQNMEALKHNFFFRGYFRKLEKQKRKNNSNPNVVSK
jgi:phospholipid/cholesterol/gamma-HCH transport system substrate-binding protein